MPHNSTMVALKLISWSATRLALAALLRMIMMAWSWRSGVVPHKSKLSYIQRNNASMSSLRTFFRNNPPPTKRTFTTVKSYGSAINDWYRALKESRESQDIPVIFISALDETIDKVKAFEVGGVDYITKPFSFEELLARLRAVLRRPKVGFNLNNNFTFISYILGKSCLILRRHKFFL